MKKKAVCLISDGLDSPVATFLLEKKGIEVVGLHFNNKPYVGLSKHQKNRENLDFEIVLSKEEKFKHSQQIESICYSLVHSFQNQKIFKLYIVPHGDDLAEIINKSDDKQITCILCKRLMLKKAEYFAKQIGATLIMTGDILGEQASQTIDNLKIIEDSLTDTRLVRPNIGLNKEEVISIAREIDTYQYSELAAKYTCTAVPNKPATKTSNERIQIAEEKLNFPNLIENSWKKALLITISETTE